MEISKLKRRIEIFRHAEPFTWNSTLKSDRSTGSRGAAEAIIGALDSFDFQRNCGE